jgi:hypothetical protein
MLRSKRWLIIALTVLAVGATGVVSDAHGRFFRWWLRPPAPAILDTSFAGTAEDGRVKTVVVVNGQLSSYTRVELGDGTFSATVAGGAITIDSIPQLVDATGNITADVSFPTSATLARNFFNSTFFAEGTALVTDNSTGTPVTTTVPVFIFGVISQCNGEYKLRADIRGLTSSTVDDGAGTVTDTYTLFKLELEAEAAVP